MNIRVMTIEDFDQVHAHWMSIKGFGIRSVDDSKEGVERLLKRNHTTSVVAEEDVQDFRLLRPGALPRRRCSTLSVFRTGLSLYSTSHSGKFLSNNKVFLLFLLSSTF